MAHWDAFDCHMQISERVGAPLNGVCDNSVSWVADEAGDASRSKL